MGFGCVYQAAAHEGEQVHGGRCAGVTAELVRKGPVVALQDNGVAKALCVRLT
jgi:hypothetical protein